MSSLTTGWCSSNSKMPQLRFNYIFTQKNFSVKGTVNVSIISGHLLFLCINMAVECYSIRKKCFDLIMSNPPRQNANLLICEESHQAGFIVNITGISQFHYLSDAYFWKIISKSLEFRILPLFTVHPCSDWRWERALKTGPWFTLLL